MARASALLDLYERHLTNVVHVVMSSATRHRDDLDDDYASLRTTDLARDVLRLADNLSVYVWPHSIGWTRRVPPPGLDTWKGSMARRPRLAPVLNWAPDRVRRAFGA
jgi:hypothetical protein